MIRYCRAFPAMAGKTEETPKNVSIDIMEIR
jgi:hypothetical protein